MTLNSGTGIGPYEILAPLGAGGMGEVYRARDTRLDRDVAIKILPEVFASDPDRRARFEREAKTLAALNHPHIAQIYGLEADTLVMELVDGEDLAARIARGAIPVDDALPIARQIADALEAAHERGIIHRDLKPANVMLTAAGDVKVLDFGLAKAMDPAGASSAVHDPMNSPTITSPATQMGMILGTAAYMAPEQAKGKAVDRRADIWAFGVVLYEMLTGRRPFVGETMTDVIAAIVTREPDWAALPPATPRPIRDLLARCLDKDPRRRLRDIGEARLALERAGAAGADAPAVAAAAPPWRRALPWAVTAAALVIALASVWMLSARPTSSSAALVRFTVLPPFGVRRPVGQGFAVSPDGRILAFSASSNDGQIRIFLRRLDEPGADPVAGSENGVLPFWSPDSRSIAFTKDGGLFRVNLDSGAQRRLCDIPGPVDGPHFARSAGTWGSEGVIVFTARTQGLFRVDENGGTPAQLTSLDTDAVHASPSFLPDGRRVMFLALPLGETRGTVYAIGLDGGARTTVTESSGGVEYVDGLLLTTTAAPRSLVAQAFDPELLRLDGPVFPIREQLELADVGGRTGFSASPQGVLVLDRSARRVQRLTWMDRHGRVVSTVGPNARIPDFALAPNETQVVVRITDSASLRSDLWLFDGSRQSGTRLTFQIDTRRPLWSHDGRRVYLTTMPGFQQWSLLVGAAHPQPFGKPAVFSHFEDATRDGRYLVVKTRGTSGAVEGLGIQDVGASAEPRALVQGPQSLAGARVSPDGRWLAYAAMLPGGPEIFVQPFDRPGDAQQVSRAGGTGPMWRADGSELYYEGRDVLMAAATAERAGVLHVATPHPLFPIRTQGFTNNQPHNVEVAANGQRFLVNAIVGNTDDAPLEVTLNWAAGLKK